MTSSTRSVLAVAAHADDEILGAGGTFAEHVRVGDRATSSSSAPAPPAAPVTLRT